MLCICHCYLCNYFYSICLIIHLHSHIRFNAVFHPHRFDSRAVNDKADLISIWSQNTNLFILSVAMIKNLNTKHWLIVYNCWPRSDFHLTMSMKIKWDEARWGGFQSVVSFLFEFSVPHWWFINWMWWSNAISMWYHIQKRPCQHSVVCSLIVGWPLCRSRLQCHRCQHQEQNERENERERKKTPTNNSNLVKQASES